jgi:large subunit ribosomal protein L16
MKIPRRTKHNKIQKGRVRGIEKKVNKLAFGSFGLQALESTRLTAKQIESARKVILKKIKRIGKLWVRVYAQIPVTKKPKGVRMGKGKGSTDHWISRVKRDRIIYEIHTTSPELSRQILQASAIKLPIKTKIIESK